MYYNTKNEVSMSTASKVVTQTDGHTHRHDENITSTAHASGNENPSASMFGATIGENYHPIESLRPNGFFGSTFWVYNLISIKISQKYAYFSQMK